MHRELGSTVALLAPLRSPMSALQRIAHLGEGRLEVLQHLGYLLLKKGRWSAVLEFGGRRTVRVGAVIG
jgi:hypothetical protein